MAHLRRSRARTQDGRLLGLRDGDRIAPDADAVERLAEAFLAELEVRFLEAT